MKRARTVVAKGLRALLGLALLLLGVAGVFALPASFARYPVITSRPGETPWLLGAWHVHTTRSDGRGTVEEVAKAAREAGLSFVVLTDHNDFTLREPLWREGVLLIPGVEISTDSGHLAAFGLERPLEGVKGWMPAGAAVDAVARAGGTAVLAHPVQWRNPWKDAESAKRVSGFELYSADTYWRQALHSPVSRLLPAVGAYLGNPLHGVMLLSAPAPEPTARLMELERERPRVALCAHDAHGIPAYLPVFQSMAMALPPDVVPAPLPTDAREAAAKVTSALSSGRAVCVFQALGSPSDFALEGVSPEPRESRVGDVLKLRLPEPPPDEVQVRVWGEGRLREDGQSVELTGPGAVQVEVWVKAPGRFFGTEWRPWLVPSPVRVVPRGPGI